MIRLRPADQRGYADHGWLQARHSFSFADYFDPEEMGWGVLRVINEDRIAPGMGFGMHGHRDMEILTYLISGRLAHRDSLGNEGEITRGEIQRMSAGKGILHSEFNASHEEETHLLQIWLLPSQPGGASSYEQQPVRLDECPDQWVTLAAPVGSEGVARLGQDATVFAARLRPESVLTRSLLPARLGYLQVVSGALCLNGVPMQAGDGAKIAAETRLTVEAGAVGAEYLFFDLPPQG